jgi:hypothetical protein
MACRSGVTAASGGAERHLEQGIRLVFAQSGVGCSPAMSNMAVKTGILEVDQPEPVAIIKEIGGQQIVVPEYDRQGALGRLKLDLKVQASRQPVAIRCCPPPACGHSRG